jgi:hypothetical protein
MLHVNRIRFWNPFFREIRFTVGTGLEIIIGYESAAQQASRAN